MNKIILILINCFIVSICSAEPQLVYALKTPVTQMIKITNKFEIFDEKMVKQDSIKATVCVDELDVETNIPQQLSFTLNEYKSNSKLDRHHKKALSYLIGKPLKVQLLNHSLGLAMPGKPTDEFIDQLENMPTGIAFTYYGLFADLYAHIAIIGQQPLYSGATFKFSWKDNEIDNPTVCLLNINPEKGEATIIYTIVSFTEDRITARVMNR